MGMRGPAPIPTNIRRLHGETRPSRVNPDEPTPPSMEPAMPDWFDERHQKVWDHAVYQLRAMHLLTAADQDALVVYVTSVVKYEEAVRLVNGAGLILRGRDGGAVKNPAVQMVRDFGASVRNMAREFGLTPAGRVGLSTKKESSDNAGAERFLSS